MKLFLGEIATDDDSSDDEVRRLTSFQRKFPRSYDSNSDSEGEWLSSGNPPILEKLKGRSIMNTENIPDSTADAVVLTIEDSRSLYTLPSHPLHDEKFEWKYPLKTY